MRRGQGRIGGSRWRLGSAAAPQPRLRSHARVSNFFFLPSTRPSLEASRYPCLPRVVLWSGLVSRKWTKDECKEEKKGGFFLIHPSKSRRPSSFLLGAFLTEAQSRRVFLLPACARSGKWLGFVEADRQVAQRGSCGEVPGWQRYGTCVRVVGRRVGRAASGGMGFLHCLVEWLLPGYLGRWAAETASNSPRLARTSSFCFRPPLPDQRCSSWQVGGKW